MVVLRMLFAIDSQGLTLLSIDGLKTAHILVNILKYYVNLT